MNSTTTGTTATGTLTAADLRKVYEDMRSCMAPVGRDPLREIGLFLGMRVVESPAVPCYVRKEFYRAPGGYRNRWLVRQERIIRTPQVFISPMLGTMFVNPRDSLLLRDFVP